jgi:histone H2B
MSLQDKVSANAVPTETNTRESETDTSGFADDSGAPAGGLEQIHFEAYIYRVLKVLHPDVGISKQAMSILNSMIAEQFHALASEAGRLAEHNASKSIGCRELQTAVRLVFPGEMAKHAVSEGTSALTRFVNNGGDGADGSFDADDDSDDDDDDDEMASLDANEADQNVDDD